MGFSGIRSSDMQVFRAAAKHFRVYILVRATNAASLSYIGMAGFSAKRLDCKAKTADKSVVVQGRTREIAGLVVDPNIVGPLAFDGDKFQKALREWTEFEPLVCRSFWQDGRRALTYFPGGKVYGVQLDPESPRYGCVLFASSSLVSAATYVHGDYDLYAIVRADKPGETLLVKDEMLGFKHFRSKELLDVQIFINKRIGRPMILHADQEKYSAHTDETVYAFFPDGTTVRELSNLAEIEGFYLTELQGRKTGGKGATLEPAEGLWKRVT